MRTSTVLDSKHELVGPVTHRAMRGTWCWVVPGDYLYGIDLQPRAAAASIASAVGTAACRGQRTGCGGYSRAELLMCG